MEGFLILLLIVLLVIYLPMKLDMFLCRDHDDLTISITLYFWLLPVRICIEKPFTKMIFSLSNNCFWDKQKPDDLRGLEVPWKRVLVRMQLFSATLLPIISEVQKFLRKTGSLIKLKKLILTTEIGLEDAAVTAVAIGIVWAIKGFFVNSLAMVFDTKGSDNRLAVIPNFQESSIIRLDYACIIEFAFGHIIVIGCYFLSRFKTIKILIWRLSQ